MTKLHEYQGKEILKNFNIPIPKSEVARTIAEVSEKAVLFKNEIAIKGQVWVTGRARLGLIKFASSVTQAVEVAGAILGREVNQQVVECVLLEEKLEIEKEFYAAIIIDDLSQSPVLIFSNKGGSGVEEISRNNPESIAKVVIDVEKGLTEYAARNLVRTLCIHGKLLLDISDILVKLFEVAKCYQVRSVEINPIVLTKNGKLYAADCRLTIDDNAVYKFPELGIEVAREFDRPPTQLEKIAWQVEKNDYRGTFFFIQMAQGFQKGEGFIGFHGAGGGGSMMSMDAILNQGYKLANFVDTSGNPPASKVYRAARIILSQKGIDGYFASGSGVASQEQFHSARGLVKAFIQTPLTVPAVIRLGGNAEEQAIDILNRAKVYIAALVEGYGKDDTPDFCAIRLKTLIVESNPEKQVVLRLEKPPLNAPDYQFGTVTGGSVSYNYERCRGCQSKICIETCVPKILSLQDDVPVLNISKEDAQKGKCIECLACEVECFLGGNRGGTVDLPVPGLEERA